MSPLLQSLLITAIGMGLVFILIILLWGFMAALVSLTNRWDFMATAEEGAEESVEEAAQATPESGVNKAGIVAAAVAAAVALGRKAFHASTIQPGSSTSWQAVSRANTLSQISSIFNRKPRG